MFCDQGKHFAKDSFERGRRQEHNSLCTATSQITYCGVPENIPTHLKALESHGGGDFPNPKSSKKKV